VHLTAEQFRAGVQRAEVHPQERLRRGGRRLRITIPAAGGHEEGGKHGEEG
jgi:hypothetical protein